jgi:hypothetical protein
LNRRKLNAFVSTLFLTPNVASVALSNGALEIARSVATSEASAFFGRPTTSRAATMEAFT